MNMSHNLSVMSLFKVKINGRLLECILNFITACFNSSLVIKWRILSNFVQIKINGSKKNPFIEWKIFLFKFLHLFNLKFCLLYFTFRSKFASKNLLKIYFMSPSLKDNLQCGIRSSLKANLISFVFKLLKLFI